MYGNVVVFLQSYHPWVYSVLLIIGEKGLRIESLTVWLQVMTFD